MEEFEGEDRGAEYSVVFYGEDMGEYQAFYHLGTMDGILIRIGRTTASSRPQTHVMSSDWGWI